MRTIVFVFAGGFCGAVARALLSAPITSLTLAAFPHAAPHFPWAIFAINLAGALALGLLYGLCERGVAIPHDVRLAIGPGFLGAFTTFSSYIVGADMLARSGEPALAGFYLVTTMALGIVCAWAGYNAAGDLIRRRVVKSGAARIDVVPTLEEDMEDEVVD